MFEIKEKISIVIPAHNESAHILNSLNEIVSTFRGLACPWEIILVDDGSDDDTYLKAEEFSRQYPGQIIIKKNSFNIGKGRAIKRALHYIGGEYVVFLDADMDLHPDQISVLFDIMKLDSADVVIGSKLHPNSVVKYPLQRRVISLGYYLLVRLLFNLPCHDTQTGIKLFRKQVLIDVLPRILVKRFAFDLEILVNAHHLGYKIAEAPIVLSPQRRYGRIGLRAVFDTCWDTLAVFYRMRILKYYDRIDYYRRKNLAKEFRRMRK